MCLTKDLNSGYDDVGFQVYLLRNGEPYCVVTAEYNCLTKKTKRQNIEQLLSDRFLLLPSGGMIGFHTRLPTSCHFGMPALPPPQIMRLLPSTQVPVDVFQTS